MEQESTQQIHPLFVFSHCQIQNSVSCLQFQKDDLLGFFYCMVWSKMYTQLPNCEWTDTIIFWSLSTAQILKCIFLLP